MERQMSIDNLYKEKYRPQFHFTAKTNWLNDPNGLIYYKGEYHLFFQHNPEGINWGNMTWGHAISPDMIHWKQIDHAIYPDKLGTIFSGSGVVDWNNTAEFKTGDEDVLVCIYTSAGDCVEPKVPFTQSIAYSNDKGRTWQKYTGNPVLEHIVGSNRDPKVIWHNPTEKWIMALFLDGNDYALFSSPNLKEWTRICDLRLPDTGECPDIFELPVDGDPNNKKWVFWGANGNHYIGSFDGQTFTPESDLMKPDFGANFYAAQTWSDIPESDGRRIQIAWMNGGKYPDMPFNQQMSFPCEITLKTTPEGIRMFRQPIRELANIRQRKHEYYDQELYNQVEMITDVYGDLFDIHAEVKLGTASDFGFVIRGEKINYNVANKEISFLGKSAKLEPIDNKLKFQILVDRTSIELFGNDGVMSMSSCFLPEKNGISAFSSGGGIRGNLVVYELKSAW
ncbi:TPA: glycoside hydrolase family 32 protein [bacterium]|nr:glycoside hydrolase family 32 protein [bacterium]